MTKLHAPPQRPFLARAHSLSTAVFHVERKSMKQHEDEEEIEKLLGSQHPPHPIPLAAEAQAISGEVLPPAAPRKRIPHNKGKGFVSKRLRFAVEQVAKGLNITQAAEIAGMSRHGLSIALARPHVIAILEQSVRANLAASAAKAARRLDTLIDGARSEYVQLEASKAVLDRSGYAQQRTETLGGDIVIEIKL